MSEEERPREAQANLGNHLTLIQQRVTAYEMQALTMKVLAAMLFGALAISGVILKSFETDGQLAAIGIIAFLVALWVTDGHFRYRQQQYVDLYRQARQGSTEVFELVVDPDQGERFPVTLWSTPNTGYYLVMVLTSAIMVVLL